MAQLAWTSPVTNRLLIEAQFGLGPDAWFGDKQRAEGYNPELIEVQENAGSVPGIAYRGQDAQRNYGYMRTFGGSLSYVTGSHRFKVGARRQNTEASFISYYNNYRLRTSSTPGFRRRSRCTETMRWTTRSRCTRRRSTRRTSGR